jgi:23S rRNA pseudouridine1911/1915/1917 synthase
MLYEHHKFIADPKQGLLRIDKFLMDRISSTSRNRIQVAIENGFIIVNDHQTKSNYRVRPYDIIKVVLPTPPCLRTVDPENITLEIKYEDDELLVVNKPSGMVVHPGHNNWTNTLANALVYHFNNLPNKNNVEGRPGLVHRIDKGTSGLLVVAKTETSMTFLAKQFYDHTIDRSYVALVWGTPNETTGTINANLTKSIEDRRVVTTTYKDVGKTAITHYRVLYSYKHVSLIQCKLETGRTHQIRAHMQHIGHPIFGDTTYGGDKILRGQLSTKYKAFVDNCLVLMPDQALHAQSLGFMHPTLGTKMMFEAELPFNFQELIGKWERVSEVKGG